MQVLKPEESALEVAALPSGVCPREVTPSSRSNAGTGKVEALRQRFQIESERYRGRVRRAIRLGVAGAGAVTLIDVISILAAAHERAASLPVALMIGAWLLYGFVLCALLLPASAAYVARIRLRDRLAHCDDVRAIGPLAEMLRSADPDSRLSATTALIALLPRLKASDADLLDADQIDCLCGVLRSCARNDFELALVILKTFEQVGDESVLPLVERMADIHARTRRQRALRVAARECLPALTARVQRERASRILLRSSSAGVTPPDHLLRPVSPHRQPADAAQLLRAESADVHPSSGGPTA